jgi:hypothetical protein
VPLTRRKPDSARAATEAPQRPMAPPPAVAHVLQLQRTIGNGAVARLAIAGGLLQRQAMAERELDKKWAVGPQNVDKAMADKLLGLKKIAMTFFVRYKGGKDPANDAEFVGASADFASTYETLGMSGNDKDGARLAFGRAIEVASRDEVTQAITSVHQTVHALAFARPAPEEGQPPLPDEPQIETVAIFSHGEPFGLGIDPANANYTKAKDLKSFVGAIRPHVAGNVRFLLFACSAGGESADKEAKADPTGPGGGGSFAQLLAKELGGEAEVFAHNVLGHTESNPLARRFTADSSQGQAMFEVLYGPAFIADEVKRLRADKKDLVDKLTDDELAKRLKSAMWKHFFDAVNTDFMRIRTKSRHFDRGGYGGIGAAMFMDPDGTGALLREDFRATWLDDATLKNDFKRVAGAAR